jgi:hypothetical protein
MLDYSCAECVALFTEMRSAVDEAKTITQKAGTLIHASKPTEHIDGWEQTRECWQSARRRWVQASTDFKTHVSTHRNTLTSAKSMAEV